MTFNQAPESSILQPLLNGKSFYAFPKYPLSYQRAEPFKVFKPLGSALSFLNILNQNNRWLKTGRNCLSLSTVQKSIQQKMDVFLYIFSIHLSKPKATDRTSSSFPVFPTTCAPNGNPRESFPQGMLIAGFPVKQKKEVYMVRALPTGTSFEPNITLEAFFIGATHGVVGVSIQSTFSRTLSNCCL